MVFHINSILFIYLFFIIFSATRCLGWLPELGQTSEISPWKASRNWLSSSERTHPNPYMLLTLLPPCAPSPLHPPLPSPSGPHPLPLFSHSTLHPPPLSPPPPRPDASRSSVGLHGHPHRQSHIRGSGGRLDDLTGGEIGGGREDCWFCLRSDSPSQWLGVF